MLCEGEREVLLEKTAFELALKSFHSKDDSETIPG